MSISSQLRRFVSRKNRNRSAPANRRRLQLERLEDRKLLAGIVLSDHEQLLLELVNRARSNPLAEAARYAIDLNQGLAAGTITTTTKEPLAPNQSLINAAGLHSQDMLDRDYFSHTTLTSGLTPTQRMTAAGYSGLSTGENIAWGGQYPTAVDQTVHVYERHESLFRSSGHRTNIMRETYDELGTGMRYGVFTSGGQNYNASMATENFGRSNGLTFITGVAYNDSVVNDNFYNVGESVANLTVRAVSSAGTIYETTTGPSGGYALNVPSGTYSVSFLGGGFTGIVNQLNIIVVAQNIKVDLDANSATWTQPPAPAIPVSTGPSTSTLASAPVLISNQLPTFQWNAVAHAANYQLWVAPVGNSTGVINTLTSLTSSTASSPLAAGSYRYVIRAINLEGEASAFSPEYYFNVFIDQPAPAIPVSTGPSTSTVATAPVSISNQLPTFQWNSVAYASTFQLWVAPIGNSNGVINALTSLTSYTAITPLAVGSYRYVIRAMNLEGEASAFSPEYYFNVFTDQPAPAIPVSTGPSTSTLATAPVLISNPLPMFQWNSVAYASTYQLWVAPVGNSNGVINAFTSQTSYTAITPLAVGSYRYVIRAINLEGEASAFSSEYFFNVVTDQPVPAIPVSTGPSTGILASSPVFISNPLPTFQWNAVAHASTYQLWVAPVGNSNGVINTFTSQTSYTALTPLAVGSYRYVIRAINLEGEASAFSSEYFFNVVTDQPVPAIPVSTGPSTSTLASAPVLISNPLPTFQWNAVAHASTYQLWVAPVENSNGVINAFTSLTSYTALTPLAVGSYRYVIRAINLEGEASAFSPEYYFDIHAT